MRETRHRKILPIVVMTILVATLAWSEAFATISSPLTRLSSNPRYLVTGGQPVVILGSGQPLPGLKNNNYKAYLDEMAAHKVNYGRVWHLLVWSSTEAYLPWARSGGGTANDGLAKYDLTKWDSNFWSRLKDCVAYAQSKDIIINIMLFDECGIELENAGHAYKYHPFHPNNNINSVGLPSSDAVPEFYQLSNSKLKQLQELYVAKLIAETSGYPNVIYEICNEYTGPWDWERHWIDFLKARCSNLIAVNRLGSYIPSEYWTSSKIDMVNFHWSTMSPGTINSNMVSYYSKGKPINYDETPEKSYITYTNYRNMLWAAFVGGGHIHLENYYQSGASYDAVLHIQNFIRSNGVRFWDMAPNNGLVTSTPGGSAYTLAKSGSEYVTYIAGSGSGSMKINLTSGVTYTARAYNPSTGAYTNLSVSGTTVSGIPSYSSDIVIYVKASGTEPITSDPNLTLTMSVDKTSALAGDTLTYTITYKNTGSGEAKNVTVTAPVPQYTTYVSGGAHNSTARTVTWTMSSIAAGATGSVTYKVKID